MNQQQRGAAAEELAAGYLAARGVEILERNFRCRMGEIDLVARDGDTLVFVEVRMRRSSAFGGAAASIDRAKQRKLVATARYYLAGRDSPPRCRFDAVLIEGAGTPRIEWLRDIISA